MADVVSHHLWQSHFDAVRRGPSTFDAVALARARTALSEELGFAEPFILPPLLAEILEAGVLWCSRGVGERYAEFGWLGADMADVSRRYECAQYMPAGVPIAFDGGGGLYLLDARGGRNDGRQPVVWSHSGSLGWEDGDHRIAAVDFESFVHDESAV
ncbi:hypothetical protein [Streptomyces sp. NPDC006285]|uniref:hypothetical protein n=1 Tax=Streptomyces sp. NPDC006285 TaxID=3364742 RepID=UPI003695950B